MNEQTGAKENAKNFVGRRKKSSARVRIMPGSGKIIVNARELNDYFKHFELQYIVKTPLEITGKIEKLDVLAKVSGGGNRGQAEAVRLGIARALCRYDEDLRKILKSNGLLSRDSRIKERKKFGLRGARRGQQWKKR
ncbi:MAG: 30S ribosomal protein S9 [bacterium]